MIEVSVIRRSGVKARMWAPGVVEIQVAAEVGSASATPSLARKYASSYFTVHQRRSIKTLSRQEPRPSMLIAIRFSCNRAVNAVLVN